MCAQRLKLLGVQCVWMECTLKGFRGKTCPPNLVDTHDQFTLWGRLWDHHHEQGSTREYIANGSICEHPRAHCRLQDWQARSGMTEAKRPLTRYQDRAGFQNLWDPEGAIGELGGDACSPFSAIFARRALKTICKPTLLLAEEIKLPSHLRVSPCCTRSREVLDLNVPSMGWLRLSGSL